MTKLEILFFVYLGINIIVGAIAIIYHKRKFKASSESQSVRDNEGKVKKCHDEFCNNHPGSNELSTCICCGMWY